MSWRIGLATAFVLVFANPVLVARAHPISLRVTNQSLAKEVCF